MMNRDETLFALEAPRVSRGRVRRGLDADTTRVRHNGVELAAGLVAALRTLADSIDALERWCRSPDARPYDRVPLTGLVREYADLYAQCFAVADAAAAPVGDPAGHRTD